MARSRADDEVQRRIGLPLGMIVALITDSNNSIRVNLPLSGTLQSWAADLSDAIWTVVKNVVVNIVSAPFKAIGRLFTGKGDTIESLAVDPARFSAGSAAVAPDAEGHLTKVADFLRRSPAITLTLAPVTTPADTESLRAQELAARLQQVQREKKLKDLDAAIADEFARVFPGEAPPKTAEEQLARLRAHEDVPPGRAGPARDAAARSDPRRARDQGRHSGRAAPRRYADGVDVRRGPRRVQDRAVTLGHAAP